MQLSLKGRTILITRRREQSGELRDNLESLGANVRFFPTIEVVPPESWGACDDALRRLQEFDLIIFASVNAVTFFLHRCVARGITPDDLSRCDLAVVGRKTGAELERVKLAPQHLPDEFSSASLVDHLSGIGVRGKRILIPQGNLGKGDLAEDLSKLGASVECITVYRTIAPDLSGVDIVLTDVTKGNIDVVTFASPSAAINFAGALPAGDLHALMSKAHIAAIGQTTADAVRNLGAEPDIVAKESSARGLAEAIAAYYSHPS